MTFRGGVLLVLVAVGQLPTAGLLVGQRADEKPRVHVIATGGTIASTASGLITAASLLETIPQLSQVAEVTFEQFLSTGSSRIMPRDWVSLSNRVQEVVDGPEAMAGIVITHGTDSMEETAYFLHLTVSSANPVVVTGAMRSADAIGADGPANLTHAVRLAASQAGRNRGTLVLMNDEIHGARAVAKTNTLRVDAFESPVVGAMGTVDPGGIVFFRESGSERGLHGGLAVPEGTSLPRVEIDYSFAGAEGSAIRTAAAGGAAGVVVATFGSGRVSAGQESAIREAIAAGVWVVFSNRSGSGRVESPPGADTVPIIFADDLNPQKARVLLMLALTHTRNPSEVAELFRVR